MAADTETGVAYELLGVLIVHSVTDDGIVSVRTEPGSPEILCDVLQAGKSGGLTLVPGDSVLCWRPNLEADRAVILGRIGQRHATTFTSQEVQEVPNELVIEARKNLTLKCGEGSITIREDGKILIKGKDLVSHAQRMNRIKGGSVSIN